MDSDQSDSEFAENLAAALSTRPVIERAKGVLMGLCGHTPDQAFEEIKYVSQKHNVKLFAVAAALGEAAAGRRILDQRQEVAVLSQWGHVLDRYPGSGYGDSSEAETA